MRTPLHKLSHRLPAIIVLTALLCANGYPQVILDRPGQFEEIVVSFEVPKLVQQDMFVQYDGQTVYVPLVKLFDALDININADLRSKKFWGFYINRNSNYEFDLAAFRIRIMGRDYPYLASDYYLGDDDLYVRVESLARMFNLRLSFDFSMMRVYLALDKDFPAYQKLKRKIAREKLSRKRAALRDVVRVAHQREYISGAAVDWSISTNPVGGRNKHYYNLVTGGMLAGGDFKITTAGSTDEPFNSEQFAYQWHYYLSDGKILTQAEIGQVHAGGSLGRSLEGAMLTNRPQERRKYFQTINISDHVGEAWEVELWVDGKLMDYMVTDAGGFYNFNTDIFYGASNIELRMFGPNGELRTEEKILRVPYNLIPKGEFEYTVTGGRAKVGGEKRAYGQANVYYGVLPALTMGVNFDMPIGADDDEKPIISGDVTCQLFGNLTLNGSMAQNYAARASLSYSRPSLVNVMAGFTKFYENRFRNPLEQLSKINFSISSPLKFSKGYLGLRYNISIDKYPDMTSMNMNYGFNASVATFYLTYIGKFKRSEFTNKSTKSMSSQFMLSSRLLRFVRPQFRVEYDHTSKSLSKYGVHLAKRVFRMGQLSLSVERNVATKSNTIMATFNLITSFADFTARFTQAGKKTSVNQLQRGSVRYNRETHSVQFDRRNAVGTGSAVVRPFHDANYNGVMDPGEEYIPGLRARISGGHINIRGAERQYYYDGLRPYEDYTVEIDQYSLDNPLLKPSNENYRVKVNPNVVTAIKVPVITASEISGRVARQLGPSLRGVGGTRIVLMNLSKESLIELTTFNNGEYYYLGLVPGSYKASIDPEQLKQFGYESRPAYIEFEIKPVEGGTFIEDINFLLVPIQGESPAGTN
ncbi:MAG: hypothetical protein JSV52_07840 [Candidatus Zixiibacteriota bacterium]|nr:MAG: hypothetical protein JSV52_07840 [candidate division Zixibacteria bacterium]